MEAANFNLQNRKKRRQAKLQCDNAQARLINTNNAAKLNPMPGGTMSLSCVLSIAAQHHRRSSASSQAIQPDLRRSPAAFVHAPAVDGSSRA
jgi:hypothetical protein